MSSLRCLQRTLRRAVLPLASHGAALSSAQPNLLAAQSFRLYSATAGGGSGNGHPEKNSLRSGVEDKNTEVHGFDPLKPRKPLSRVAIGADPKQKASKGMSAPSIKATWMSAVIVLVIGGGIMYFFRREKRRLEVRRSEREHQGVGKPKIGGPFNLIDQDGKAFTDKDLLGKFSILYFGFSMCPDVCPEELEVLAKVLKVVNKDGERLQPIFVTCDPARDTPEVLKEYLSDFSPEIVGLTGTYDEIKNICKEYRVYFSTPPDIKPGQQYLVDHSIFFYLMDPEGQFIDVMGRNYNAEQAITKIEEHLDSWRPAGVVDRSWVQKIFG